MDIEIQNKKNEALFKNGKYQFTFIPKLPTEKIKIHHMGCVGDTRLNHIQLEQGTEVTSFVAPDKKVNSLSGIFKQLRDLDIQMRDQNSELWGKIKLNNAGAILDFYDKKIKTEISTLAGKFNLAISELDNKVLKKTDVSITSNGITLGSGKTIDGRTIASIMKVQPDSIDLISPLIRVTGNMVVDGTLEGRKIKANTLETGHHKAGSITTELLAANAVKADKLLVDNAMIEKFLANSAFITELFAKRAFINQLQTVKITSTQIDVDTLYGKELNGVTITGTSKIKLGQHGFLQPTTNGLQINAPESYGANSGIGVQIHGYKKVITSNLAVPEGMFIYRDEDFSTGDTVSTKNSTLLTVQGRIECRSLSDGNGSYKYGYAIPTITAFDEGGKGLYPIMNIYHQDNSNGQFLLYTVPGTYFSVATQRESDVRLKKNIKNTKVVALDIIDNIKFKSYDWKDTNKGHEKLGMIAQELEHLEKSLVNLVVFDDGTERYTLDTPTLNIYSLKAIQELSTELNKLEKRIKQMEEKLYAA